MNSSEKFFVKRFENGENEILFFGCLHSKSVEQLNKINETISEFKPNIILVEGNYHLADFKSEKEAIELGMEMGYTSFLAKERKIELKSNDPSFSKDISFVERKYNKEIAFIYFFLRNRNFVFSDEEVIQDIKENSSWKDFDYSISNFLLIIKEKLLEEYNSNKDYSDYFNPTLKINIFNKISFELSEFRDNFMLDNLKEFLKTSKRIFLIKGTYHLNKNEEKIRRLIENVGT